ncbi:MAG: hypothetical protein ACLUTA_06685 [Blautia wexlerae]
MNWSQGLCDRCRSQRCKEIPQIIWSNVFPNALLPLITMFGLSIGCTS